MSRRNRSLLRLRAYLSAAAMLSLLTVFLPAAALTGGFSDAEDLIWGGISVLLFPIGAISLDSLIHRLAREAGRQDLIDRSTRSIAAMGNPILKVRIVEELLRSDTGESGHA